MKKQNEMKKFTIVSIGIALFFLVILIGSAYVYCETQKVWISTVGYVAIIMILLVNVIYPLGAWWLFTRRLMQEYYNKNDLLSGGIGVLMAYLMPLVILVLISTIPNIPEGISKLYSMGINLLLATIPALIGLIGVQYSITLHEKNRKEELRLGAKPFLIIDCSSVEREQMGNNDGFDVIHIGITLKNISKNIAILSGATLQGGENCGPSIEYYPLASNDRYECNLKIKIANHNKHKVEGVIYYGDVYENKYILRFQILLFENISAVKVKIISDSLDENIALSHD